MKKILVIFIIVLLSTGCSAKAKAIQTDIKEIEIQAGSEFKLSDFFSFTDKNGNDITDQAKIDKDVDTKTLGATQIRIDIKIDDVAYYHQLTVNVIDTTPPVLELVSPFFYYPKGVELDPIDAVIHVSDNYDLELNIENVTFELEALGYTNTIQEEVPETKMHFKVSDRMGNETSQTLSAFEIEPVRYINNSPYPVERFVQPIYDAAYRLGFSIQLNGRFDHQVVVVQTVEEAIAVIENHQGEKRISVYADAANTNNGIALFLGK